MSKPTADVSVRVAWADDAGAIADVQVRAWRETYAGVVPVEDLDNLPADEFEAAWLQSVARPREARQRVFVALESAAAPRSSWPVSGWRQRMPTFRSATVRK